MTANLLLSRLKNLLVPAVIICCATVAQAQEETRFRIGVGGNLVTNNYEDTNLEAYAAFSLNSAYTLLQQTNFRVLWEQNLLFRSRDNDGDRNTALIASFPLSFRYQPRRTGFYLGMGPAYLLQRRKYYGEVDQVSGLHATAHVGVAVRSRPAEGMLFQEVHIRGGVHHSLDGSNNIAPFLSLIVQAGGQKRAD